MKQKIIILTAVLLAIFTGNYFRITSNNSIRTVDFLSIFVIGALSGILITQLIKFLRNKKQSS